MTENIQQALKGLEMYIDAIDKMDVTEFDSVYNWVVKNGLTNWQIENLIEDLKHF